MIGIEIYRDKTLFGCTVCTRQFSTGGLDLIQRAGGSCFLPREVLGFFEGSHWQDVGDLQSTTQKSEDDTNIYMDENQTELERQDSLWLWALYHNLRYNLELQGHVSYQQGYQEKCLVSLRGFTGRTWVIYSLQHRTLMIEMENGDLWIK